MEYFIYSLYHGYEKENKSLSVKFIGLYNSRKNINIGINDAIKLSGFKNYPNDFHIRKYVLNKIHWKKGFSNVVGEDNIPENDNISGCTLFNEKSVNGLIRLTHAYTLNSFLDDEREIGIFSSEEIVKVAIESLINRPGFKLHIDDFHFGYYEFNYNYWTTGF